MKSSGNIVIYTHLNCKITAIIIYKSSFTEVRKHILPSLVMLIASYPRDIKKKKPTTHHPFFISFTVFFVTSKFVKKKINLFIKYLVLRFQTFGMKRELLDHMQHLFLFFSLQKCIGRFLICPPSGYMVVPRRRELFLYTYSVQSIQADRDTNKRVEDSNCPAGGSMTFQVKLPLCSLLSLSLSFRPTTIKPSTLMLHCRIYPDLICLPPSSEFKNNFFPKKKNFFLKK